MRLIEAIMQASQRALAGDSSAGVHPSDHADSLPLVALTCIDVRLNALLPQALAVAPEQFIWLRNAGNIITSSLSSTMRSLALACAVKGGREIVILGHSDCKIRSTTTLDLIERFRAMGIERSRLPENLTEYFGVFASERQNVLKAVEYVRASPLIGPRIPVHGLLIELETGKLEWLLNGYQALEAANVHAPALTATHTELEEPAPVRRPANEALRTSEARIGEMEIGGQVWSAHPPAPAAGRSDPIGTPPPKAPAAPPPLPAPPPIKMSGKLSARPKHQQTQWSKG